MQFGAGSNGRNAAVHQARSRRHDTHGGGADGFGRSPDNLHRIPRLARQYADLVTSFYTAHFDLDRTKNVV